MREFIRTNQINRSTKRLGIVGLLCLILTGGLVFSDIGALADTTGNDPIKLSKEAAKDDSPILPGNTPKRTVKFFDGKNQLIAGIEQEVIAGDKIFEPEYPGQIEGKIFDHWALKTTEPRWEAKVFDFNQKIVANTAGIPVVDGQIGAEDFTALANSGDIELYAQYRNQHTIRFLIPNANGEKEDRVVYSFLEKDSCNPGTELSENCTFGSYRKAVKIFLEARRYVKGWTRNRNQALNFDPDNTTDSNDPSLGLVPDPEKLDSNENFYAVIVEGVEVDFNSRGGTQVNPVYVDSGEKVNPPAKPSRPGYIFLGWTQDEKKPAVQEEKKAENLFDFENTRITEDTKLYAIWSPNKTTINVQYMVEDIVDKNGQRLPLYYDVYDQMGDEPETRKFVASSIDGGQEGDAAREAAKREGVYRLQKTDVLNKDPKTQKDYFTGQQIDLNNVCDHEDLKKRFDPMYFDFEDPKEQPNAGLAADGSTTFNCKIKRKRGSYLVYWDNNKKQIYSDSSKNNVCAVDSDKISYTENGEKHEYKCRLTVLKFHSLLGGNVVQKGTPDSYGTVLPGEKIDRVYEKAWAEFTKRIGIDTKDWAIYNQIAGENRNEVTGVITKKKKAEYYANPPGYYPDLLETLLVIVPPQKALVYIRAEIDDKYLVTKNTSDYSRSKLKPRGLRQRFAELTGTNQSPRYVEPKLEENQFLEETPITVKIVDENTSATLADFDSRPGFKRLIYPGGHSYQRCCSFKLGKDNPASVANGNKQELPFKPDWLPQIVKDSYQPITGKEMAEALVLVYKRLSYDLMFLAGDSTVYTSPIPYNWSVNKAANTEYVYSDKKDKLEQAKGLAEFLKKYVPGKTTREDGAVFEGWCTSLPCGAGTDNPLLDLDTYKMPYFDTYLVAKWKPVKVKLRVFYDANKLDRHDPYEYNLNDQIDPKNYESPHVPEGLDLTAEDFKNWVYRERYPLTDEKGRPLLDENGNPKMRDGDWRVFDPNVRMSHDIDMVPLWKFEVYEIRYLPGLTTAEGEAKGPQGTGETKQNRKYYPLLTSARLKDSGFTAPEGYVFGGWYDEAEEKLYQPDDDVLVVHNQLTFKARWLPLPPKTALTYHSNYPQGVTNPAKTKEVGKESNKNVLPNNAVKEIEGLPEDWKIPGWKFLGWAETAVVGSESSEENTPNPNVRYTAPVDSQAKDSNVNEVLLNYRHRNDLYAVWEKLPSIEFYVHKISDETDEAGKPVALAGAKFGLYANNEGRPGKEILADLPIVADANCVAKESSTTNNSGNAEENSAGDAASTSESTGDSTPPAETPSGSCYGTEVPAGDYFLVEKQAPEGYELLAVPVQFSVNDKNVTLAESEVLPAVSATGKIISITNTKKVALPLSGGLGIYVLLIAGFSLGLAGAYWNYRNQKTKN